MANRIRALAPATIAAAAGLAACGNLHPPLPVQESFESGTPGLDELLTGNSEYWISKTRGANALNRMRSITNPPFSKTVSGNLRIVSGNCHSCKPAGKSCCGVFASSPATVVASPT